MPFCNASSGESIDVKIFYRIYGHGLTKVLFITGFAGTHDSWSLQIKGLTGTDKPNDDDQSPSTDWNSGEIEFDRGSRSVEVCAFDNRGMGRSTVPTKKSEYTTKIMAQDVIALLDHLGWQKAHIFGHSMGAMIACKLAAMEPKRVLSLALLNVTGGGFQCFPKIDRHTISIMIRFLMAKTPEKRADVDLDTHYTKEYLEEYVGSLTRRAVLYQQYVSRISKRGMQTRCGFDGQMNACWTHGLTGTELQSIRSAGFLISVIHGRYDVIAQICYARKLAEKLQPVARMVDIYGAHLVSNERSDEVNQALIELIRATDARMNPEEWSNLQVKNSGESGDGGVFAFNDMLRKLRICLMYVFTLFALAVGYVRRPLRNLKLSGMT